jgi:hypothetical protein
MNRAALACVACTVALSVVGLQACSSKPATTSVSCTAQLAAWENTGVLADLKKLPGQLDTTSNHVMVASLNMPLSALPDDNAISADLNTLVSEGNLLAAHKPPACMPKLSADYATMLRDHATLEKHVREYLQDSGGPLASIAANLAELATTLSKEDVGAVTKDLSS